MTRRALGICAGLLLVTGCGAAPPRPELPTREGCDQYGRELAPALGRIGKAADQFMDRISARTRESAEAARDLTELLVKERAQLGAMRIEARALEERHARLTHALGDLAGAMRGLAEAIGGADAEARRQALHGLERAARAWGEATQGIRDLCPEAGGALDTPEP